MKNLLKFSAFALVLAMGTFLSSCKDDGDVCYDCKAYTDEFGNEIGAQSLCEGDDLLGTTLNAATVKAWAEAWESTGGECDKK